MDVASTVIDQKLGECGDSTISNVLNFGFGNAVFHTEQSLIEDVCIAKFGELLGCEFQIFQVTS